MGLDSGTTLAYRGVVERAVARAGEVPDPARTQGALTVATDRFFATLDAHYDRLKKIRVDIMLSQEGRRQAEVKHDEQLEREAAAALSRFNELATQYRDRLERTISESAGTVPEERLANARADARMVLDGANGVPIVERLKELADDDDEAMAHLLLRTKWPEYYLQSRGEESLLSVFQDFRRAIMNRVLSAAGMAAFQSLDAAHGLVEAGQHLNSALQFYEKDRTAGML